jgi:hypothetical protein
MSILARTKLSRRNSLLWLSVLVGLLGADMFAAPARAQYGGMPIMPYVPRTNRQYNNNNPNSQQNRGVQQFSGSATIRAVGSLGLEVTDANGKNWALKPDKNCQIVVTGTADPDFLKPDLLVRFTAQFDKKGNATVPLNELEIISQQAAITSLKAESSAKKDSAAAATNGPTVGHIKSIKNNQLTVQTPGGTYTAELSANPSIKVNVSDLRWAQAGDKVDASGYYSPQGLALAERISVTLATPLGENGKKKIGKTTGTAANK